MEIKIKKSPQTVTFILSGELIANKIIQLKELLEDFTTNDTSDALIDMKDISKIDSLSIGTFISVKKELTQQGRKFKIINPNENVTKIIELASLESFLLED